MLRKVVNSALGSLAVAMLWTSAAFGTTVINPENYSFEIDDALSEGCLEGSEYPKEWTFIDPSDGRYLDIVNNDVLWGAGTGFEGVTDAQYCWLYGAGVSPGITQTLGDTVRAGSKYQLLVDLAGDFSGSSVSATLTLSAGIGAETAEVATITIATDKLTDGVFSPFSTDLAFPSQSLVGRPLTVTITPGSVGTEDFNYGIGVDNVRILQSALMLGDANGDGIVDINDLSKVLTNYDPSGMAWTDGDTNCDGRVDINDLSMVLTNYDKSMSASYVLPVPEPGGAVLLLAGLAGLLAYLRCPASFALGAARRSRSFGHAGKKSMNAMAKRPPAD